MNTFLTCYLSGSAAILLVLITVARQPEAARAIRERGRLFATGAAAFLSLFWLPVLLLMALFPRLKGL